MMDQSRPVCFKVAISKDDQFTRMKVLKVLPIEDAKKEKVEVKKQAAPVNRDPIYVKIEVGNDPEILEKLHRLVSEYPGSRPLKLILASKLQDVVIESKIAVNEMILEKLETLEEIKVAA